MSKPDAHGHRLTHVGHPDHGEHHDKLTHGFSSQSAILPSVSNREEESSDTTDFVRHFTRQIPEEGLPVRNFNPPFVNPESFQGVWPAASWNRPEPNASWWEEDRTYEMRVQDVAKKQLTQLADAAKAIQSHHQDKSKILRLDRTSTSTMPLTTSSIDTQANADEQRIDSVEEIERFGSPKTSAKWYSLSPLGVGRFFGGIRY